MAGKGSGRPGPPSDRVLVTAGFNPRKASQGRRGSGSPLSPAGAAGPRAKAEAA